MKNHSKIYLDMKLKDPTLNNRTGYISSLDRRLGSQLLVGLVPFLQDTD